MTAVPNTVSIDADAEELVADDVVSAELLAVELAAPGPRVILPAVLESVVANT